MRASAKKITTAAVCTALAVIMCVCTAYLPLSIMPLYFAAFCIFLSFKRGSLAYGLLCIAATLGLMFAMTGLSVKWFFMAIMFAPYSLFCFFMHRFAYFKVKSGLIRGAAAVAFFNITLAAVYLIATKALTAGIDLDIAGWVDKLGGYWVLAIVGTVIMLPLDFIFSTMSGVVLKRLPAATDGRKKTKEQLDAIYGAPEEGKEQPPEVDIFGYEVKKEGDEEESE